jgi:hypothetical protein
MRPGIAAGFMLSFLWLTIALPGCASPSGSKGERSLRVLGGSLYCSRQEPAPLVRQAGSAAEYTRLLAEYDLDGPALDFTNEIVVLVALGQRPTLGYALEPATSRIPIQNGTAVIPMVVREPPPDAMVGQALTSPCLVLGLERAGLSAVEVKDQDGRLLGRTPVE